MYREDYSGVTYTLHGELSRNCLLLSLASYIVGFILDNHQQILGSKKIWAFSNKLDAYLLYCTIKLSRNKETHPIKLDSLSLAVSDNLSPESEVLSSYADIP